MICCIPTFIIIYGKSKQESDCFMLKNKKTFMYFQVVDVNDIPIVCHKRLKPLAQQSPMESRRLWHDVSVALARGDVETATSHKRALEEQQRKEERERAAQNVPFPTRLFHSPTSDHWVYNQLPAYSFTSCPASVQPQ